MLYSFGKGERMSKKNVIVSNVSEGHDNPIAELVQVACQFDSDIMLESDNRRINARALWELWRLIHPMECQLTLWQRVPMKKLHLMQLKNF